MKVLHLNTHAEGGSYIYASLLNSSLKELGIDSQVATRDTDSRPFMDKLLRRGALAFTKGAWHGTRRCGLAPDPGLMKDVDVVHLHTVADWFNVPTWLATLPTHVRVVIGLHDLWHVSGGCFVHDECNAYQDRCGQCPLLRFPANRFLAADELRRKREIYRRRDVRFVVNSQWLKSVAESSTVVNGAKVAVIPPPVDPVFFSPQDREKCRIEFGLMPDDLVVATGCASLTDQNKNTSGLLEILGSLREPRLRVLVFGEGSIPSPPELRVTWLGPMKDKRALARIYSAADVFASASRMETYGLTLVEALACGSPIVAYRVGGIPEAVSGDEGSSLCSPFDAEEFALNLRETLVNRDKQALSASRRSEETALRCGPCSAAEEAVRIYRPAI